MNLYVENALGLEIMYGDVSEAATRLKTSKQRIDHYVKGRSKDPVMKKKVITVLKEIASERETKKAKALV